MRANLFKGAAAEQLAAAYYLNRNEAVFWPAVPLETDFIVQRAGRFDRIQVKYAGWNKHHGNYEHLHCRTYGWSGGRRKTKGKPAYDYLFVVSEDGRQWEIPAASLPPHAITLDTRGGKYLAPRKASRKWDQYQLTP